MLDRVVKALTKPVFPISRVLANTAIVIMILTIPLVVTDVFLRRAFNAPMHGTNDLIRLAFSIIVFLPLAWCTMIDSHIEMDFITKRLPKTVQRTLDVIMISITTVVVGLLAWQLGVQGTVLQAAGAETVILQIPMYPFLYLATFGAIILTIAFIITFLRIFKKEY